MISCGGSGTASGSNRSPTATSASETSAGPTDCVVGPNADCADADLRGADLSGVIAYGIDLSGADLSGADLTGADLNGADLTGADLTDASLVGAILREADLTGALLDGASLGAVEVDDNGDTPIDRVRGLEDDALARLLGVPFGELAVTLSTSYIELEPAAVIATAAEAACHNEPVAGAGLVEGQSVASAFAVYSPGVGDELVDREGARSEERDGVRSHRGYAAESWILPDELTASAVRFVRYVLCVDESVATPIGDCGEYLWEGQTVVLDVYRQHVRLRLVDAVTGQDVATGEFDGPGEVGECPSHTTAPYVVQRPWWQDDFAAVFEAYLSRPGG